MSEYRIHRYRCFRLRTVFACRRRLSYPLWYKPFLHLTFNILHSLTQQRNGPRAGAVFIELDADNVIKLLWSVRCQEEKREKEFDKRLRVLYDIQKRRYSMFDGERMKIKVKELATVQMGYSFRSRLEAVEDGTSCWTDDSTPWKDLSNL